MTRRTIITRRGFTQRLRIKSRILDAIFVRGAGAFRLRLVSRAAIRVGHMTVEVAITRVIKMLRKVLTVVWTVKFTMIKFFSKVWVVVLVVTKATFVYRDGCT